MSTEAPKVLIIGAGVGGLTLAQALRQKGVPFEIFERDAAADARPQGWGITLHQMLKDLAASLPDDLPDMRTLDATGGELRARGRYYDLRSGALRSSVERATDGTPILRGDRGKLRPWLESGLDIRWGKSFERVEHDGDGVVACFADGTRAGGAVLVGADGVNSHVRAQLTGPTGPQPAPLALPNIWAVPTLTGPALDATLEHGPSWYVAADNSAAPERAQRLFCGIKNVTGHGDARRGVFYWTLSWTEPGAERDDFWAWHAPPAQLLAYVRERATGFAAPFRTLVEATAEEDVLCPPIRLRDMLPFELPRGRVTLLGDAAHPMAPYRGEGGNHAMQDALNIARAVAGATDGTSIEDVLKRYEAEMMERCTESVLGSRKAALNVAASDPAVYAPWAKEEKAVE